MYYPSLPYNIITNSTSWQLIYSLHLSLVALHLRNQLLTYTTPLFPAVASASFQVACTSNNKWHRRKEKKWHFPTKPHYGMRISSWMPNDLLGVDWQANVEDLPPWVSHSAFVCCTTSEQRHSSFTKSLSWKPWHLIKHGEFLWHQMIYSLDKLLAGYSWIARVHCWGLHSLSVATTFTISSPLRVPS